MDIDPFSMLEVSLQEPENEEGDSDCMVVELSSGQGSQNVRPFQSNDAGRSVQLHPLFNSKELSNTPLNAVMANKERLAITTKDEERYRRKTFSSLNFVLKKRLHCTVCDGHVGAHLGLKNEEIEHPLLRVLVCTRCTNKYRLMEFPLTPEGRDIRCRWCTSSSTEERPLRFCKDCPFAFCEMCIYRNLPLDELAIKDNWVCFVCNIQDLWPSRAVLWALRVLIDTNLAMNEDRRWRTDQSTCCKSAFTGTPRPRNRAITVNRPLPTGVQYKSTPQTNGHLKSIIRSHPIRQPVPQPLKQQQQQRFQMQQKMQRFNPPKNNGQQLYETQWLTGKIRLICNSLMTLHSNLTRLSSGIPDMENKYSIKSKLISMVSLLNISATQLQKASKDMEVESKRLLDKNHPVTQMPGVEIIKKVTSPVVKVKQKSEELSPIITMTQTIKMEKDIYEKVKPEVISSENGTIITKPCYVRLVRLSTDDLKRPLDVEDERPKTTEPVHSRNKNRKRKRKPSSASRDKKVKGDVNDLDDDSRTGVSGYSQDDDSRGVRSEHEDTAEGVTVINSEDKTKSTEEQQKEEIVQNKDEVNGEAPAKCGKEDAVEPPEMISAPVGKNDDSPAPIEDKRVVSPAPVEDKRDVSPAPVEDKRDDCPAPVEDKRDDSPAPVEDKRDDSPVHDVEVSRDCTLDNECQAEKDNSPAPVEENLNHSIEDLLGDKGSADPDDTAQPVESTDEESTEVKKTDLADEKVANSDEYGENPVTTTAATPAPSAPVTTPASQQSEKLKKLLQRMQNNKV